MLLSPYNSIILPTYDLLIPAHDTNKVLGPQRMKNINIYIYIYFISVNWIEGKHNIDVFQCFQNWTNSKSYGVLNRNEEKILKSSNSSGCCKKQSLLTLEGKSRKKKFTKKEKEKKSRRRKVKKNGQFHIMSVQHDTSPYTYCRKT